ncbi:MAG: hypothetical protein ACLUMN_09010, partial [Oscillospiraceae bacterium]
FSQPHMSPEKMIGLSFAAPAAKGYEVFDKLTKRRGGAPAFLRTRSQRTVLNSLRFDSILFVTPASKEATDHGDLNQGALCAAPDD